MDVLFSCSIDNPFPSLPIKYIITKRINVTLFEKYFRGETLYYDKKIYQYLALGRAWAALSGDLNGPMTERIVSNVRGWMGGGDGQLSYFSTAIQ